MSKEISERISSLIEELGLSKQDFSAATGISPASLSKYTSGASAPSYESLEKIAKAYPGVNLRWLVVGEGDMLSAGGASNVITRELHDALQNELAAQRKLVQAYELVLYQRGLLAPEPMRRAS